MASHDNRQQRDHTAQRSIPERMSNYHQLDPRHVAHGLRSDYHHPTLRRPIPGRMSNYLEIHQSETNTTDTNLRTNNRSRKVAPQYPQYEMLHGVSIESQDSSSTTRLLGGERAIELHTQFFISYANSKQTAPHHQVSENSSRNSHETQEDTPTRKNPLQKISKVLQGADSSYKGRIRRSSLHGWRMGVLLGSCVSAFVLLCNIALVIIGLKRSGYDEDGIATLLEDDEATITRWNTFAHVAINALSTVLLSMSNYTMQVLNSPTRQEVDKAHKRGKWLDIGLLSLHNLRIISRKRAILCLIMALSSMPLHLFYNASVFKIITKATYQVTIMEASSAGFQKIRNDNTSVQLQNAQWKNIYNDDYVSKYGDLYLGIDQLAFNASMGPIGGSFSIADYLPRDVPSTSFKSYTRPSSEGWVPFEWVLNTRNASQPLTVHIMEGFTTDLGRNSRIQVNLWFMVIVISFNLFKLAIMLSTLIMDRSDYLVTLGDAAASFLEDPEPLTDGKCTLETEELFSSYQGLSTVGDSDTSGAENIGTLPQGIWQPRPRRYCSSIGFDKAWSATIAGACLVLILVVFPTRVNNLDVGIWKWGTASGGALSFGSNAASTKGTTWNAWLSNMPQVFLSMSYLNLNTICTSMASSAEWNTFATSRKGLRVTKPFGEQRSTYFLQLPYKWALPLMVFSGCLHWLLSQTFYLIRIDFFNRKGELEKWTSACGISFSSLLTFCLVALFVVCTLRWVGRRPMYPKLPLAESCSLMISAACHPAPDEVDAHLAKVKWGVVTGMTMKGQGHCSLSSKPVEKPKVGNVYH